MIHLDILHRKIDLLRNVRSGTHLSYLMKGFSPLNVLWQTTTATLTTRWIDSELNKLNSSY